VVFVGKGGKVNQLLTQPASVGDEQQHVRLRGNGPIHQPEVTKETQEDSQEVIRISVNTKNPEIS